MAKDADDGGARWGPVSGLIAAQAGDTAPHELVVVLHSRRGPVGDTLWSM